LTSARVITVGRRTGRRARTTFETRLRLFENRPVEEEESGEGLILGRGRDLSSNRQIRKKRVDLGFPHLDGMALAVEQDETPDPSDVGLLGPEAVVTGADR
jgi:hypothetical protein